MLRSKEIGSEFWFDTEIVGSLNLRTNTLVLSGRTAIDLIIYDIKKKRNVRNVYLPAYCCDSMIDPFLRNAIEVILYDIRFDGELYYLVDETKDVDVFYVNNYFGYENTISNNVIEHFRQKGTIIIYDKTHSLFMSNDSADTLADFSFASIRKWMGVIDGAVVNKKEGGFDMVLRDYPHLQCKIEAMEEKAKFLNGDNSIDKQQFLNKYGEFGHHLSEDYQRYRMDDTSVAIWQQSDKISLRNVRRENAAILHSSRRMQFIGQLTVNSCPIFVPVFFNTTDERNAVRKRLIENQIFCPIHWPKNQLVSPGMEVNKLFDTELSLICDQRYTVADMDRIIEVINNK